VTFGFGVGVWAEAEQAIARMNSEPTNLQDDMCPLLLITRYPRVNGITGRGTPGHCLCEITNIDNVMAAG
jgi:hypothetical protein